MRPILFASLALGALACGSSKPAPSSPEDAGVDAAPIDAGVDTSIGFPPAEDANVPSPDAGSPCDQLRRQAQDKAAAASACDPSATQQCGGTTQGICCPITITFGHDPQAVDDFNAAVQAFKNAGCTVDCTILPCGTAPSNKCDGSGHVGVCE